MLASNDANPVLEPLSAVHGPNEEEECPPVVINAHRQFQVGNSPAERMTTSFFAGKHPKAIRDAFRIGFNLPHPWMTFDDVFSQLNHGNGGLAAA